MKMIRILIVAIFMISLSTFSYGEMLQKVAKVNINRINSEIGYQRLAYINMKGDVKAEVQKLKKKQDKILLDILKEEDEGRVAILQNSMKSINSKLSTIQSAMRNSGSRDYRKTLRNYISEHYSKNYDLILDAGTLQSNNHLVIHESGEIEDITDEILQKLNEDIP